jgi:hypothetical protein
MRPNERRGRLPKLLFSFVLDLFSSSPFLCYYFSRVSYATQDMNEQDLLMILRTAHAQAEHMGNNSRSRVAAEIIRTNITAVEGRIDSCRKISMICVPFHQIKLDRIGPAQAQSKPITRTRTGSIG